ncbi:NACHT domain-containing protein [Actinokineospora sp. 24-640]
MTGSDLVDTASIRECLTNHLTALPAKGDGPGPELVVVLDQLDECTVPQTLPRQIERSLAGRDTSGLRLLVACRTAEYPPRLTQVLLGAFTSCLVADLAPLRREDAARLVESTGVPSGDFLDAVVENRAGVLAGNPLTLKVLLAAYRHRPEELGGGPARLFELGVAGLLEEPDRDRQHSEVTSADQRLVIASRIAAYILLCGQRTLWTGDRAGMGGHDVPSDAACGGRETSGAGGFEVTPQAVQETLRTALFTRTGENRVAFAHSSFAAYLAALHLATRLRGHGKAAQRQLASVFVVTVPEDDAASIPGYLHETAAWLLAHAPSEARWLVRADPEGLAAHSAYFTSPDVRAQLVESLLDRAVSIELTDRAWQRTRWQLDHAGLAAQIQAVFQDTGFDASDTKRLARTRLAVRFAHDAGIEELVPSLVGVAVAPEWPLDLRWSAAYAAMETGPGQAGPRLRDLLVSLALADSTSPHGGGADSSNDQQELVTELVDLLWPDYLTFVEAAPHIVPVPEGSAGHLSEWRLRRFVAGVADADVGMLVQHVEDVLTVVGVDLDRRSSDTDLDDHEDVGISPVAGAALDRETVLDFLAPLIDRVLSARDVAGHLPRIARVITWAMQAADRLPMPSAASAADADSCPAETTALFRRSLAEALVRSFVERTDSFISYYAHLITAHWKHPANWVSRPLDKKPQGERINLLDNDDFSWALSRVDHHRASGDSAMADAMGSLAGRIGDFSDRGTFDLAYQRKDTPEWDHLRHVYEPVVLDSSLARAMRRSQDRPWAGLDSFTAMQNTRLQAAVDGDTNAFWTLVKDLAVDLEKGQYTSVSTWRLTAFPAASLWPEEHLRAQLTAAAPTYLRNEHDRRSTWLGLPKVSYVADAGFAALALLYDSGQLDSLPDSRWEAWAGAILDNVGRRRSSESAMYDTLLGRAMQHAPEALGSALAQMIRTPLSRSQTPPQLPPLPHTLVPLIAELAAEVLTALKQHTIVDNPGSEPESNRIVTVGPVVLPSTKAGRDAAFSAWTKLIRLTLNAGDPAAINSALTTLNDAEGDLPDVRLRLAVCAASALLHADARSHWSGVHAQIVTRLDFADRLARHFADGYSRPLVADELPDRALLQAHRWLAAIVEPAPPVRRRGVYTLTADDRIRQWSHDILAELARRGTDDAIRGLRELTREHPDSQVYKGVLIVARRNHADSVSPLRHTDVTTLLTDTARRIVNTTPQLAQLILDTLHDIQNDLHTHGNLLWDSERTPRPPGTTGHRPPPTWRPKPEGALAAYTTLQLTLRLQHHPVVINREVMIHPTDAGDSGERPDILVTANPLHNDTTTDTLTLPIEIKGAWHSYLHTAQQDQLANRYLPDLNTDTGIYLIGWYPIDHWNAPDDPRHRTARRNSPPTELLHQLTQQAQTIFTETGRRTHPHIITIPRATKPS